MHLTRPPKRPAHCVFGRPQLLASVTLLCLLSGAPAWAQLPQTRLYSVFPPGGKAGSTVDVTVTSGADLDEADRLYFNHPGLKAVQKTQGPADAPQPVANSFVVTVDEGVPPGLYEVRTAGLFGLSNPRTWVVSGNSETRESEPNNSFEQAGEIAYDQVANGRADAATDVDVFKFQGKKGERVIVTCRAARIDSRMMATCELFDHGMKRLAYGKNDVRGDPLLDVTLPEDGTYFVKLYDFLYRGGAEYFYRLTVGTKTHIDFIMPPAGLPGSTSTYTLYGRNLPNGQPADMSIDGRPLEKLDVEISLPDDPAVLKTVEHSRSFEAMIDGISYALPAPAGPSNPVRIHFAAAPVTIEQEPNDEPSQAQAIKLPGEFVGQFQSRGDVDYVTFEAKANEIYYVEVFAQRSLSSADPFLILEQVTKNDKGEESVKRITALDDDNTNLSANVFDTRTDDPVYRFQVPADGTYRVSVRDRYFETRGDPSLGYRLSIRQAQPDFRLVVLPFYPVQGANKGTATWSLGLRKGDSRGVQVLAFRRDGYSETIECYAEGMPEGVTCPGAAIGPGSNSAELIFTAAADAPEWAGTIRAFGKTRFDDANKVAAVNSAAAARTAARQTVDQLVKAAATADEALEHAKQQLAKAKEAAEKNPGDADLAALAAQAQKAVEAATDTANKANQARQAAEKQFADATAALEAAKSARDAAVREVVREARIGTVVWGGAPNVPAVSRVAGSLGLSVLKETAPFQVTTNLFRVEANQSRQILVPVTLTKRGGFDNDVKLTMIGLPKNTNIDVENKPIKKGQNEELFKIFVKHNARLGTYTLVLKSEAQVAYRRNPYAAERAKVEQAANAKAAQEVAEAAKLTVAARDEAVKQVETAQTVLAQAKEAIPVAEKKVVELDAQVATAEKETAGLVKAALQATESADAAARVAALAQKLAEEADAKAKAAADAMAAAESKRAESKQAAEKARVEVEAAKKAVPESEARLKASQEAQAAAEAAAKEAEARSKAAAEAKAAADKKAAEAEKAAAPKNINDFPLSNPIVLTVKRAPVTLKASVPDSGKLKAGEQIEVAVKIQRKHGFNGPITLTLPLPPNVGGLTAEPVTVSADQETGKLVIRAAADAAKGKPANMVVRAEMDFEGEAIVDAPIQLNIVE